MKQYIKETALMILIIWALGLIDPALAGLMGLILMFRIIIVASIAIGFPIFIALRRIEEG